MLKFQTNYTTTIQNFEDFILVVFVFIDDLYHAYAPTSVTQRRNVEQAKLSDSEIITISICGELVGIDSENAWFSFVKRIINIFFRTSEAEVVLTEHAEPSFQSLNYCVKNYYLHFLYRATSILS